MMTPTNWSLQYWTFELLINITIAHLNLPSLQFVPLYPFVETSMLELPPNSILSSSALLGVACKLDPFVLFCISVDSNVLLLEFTIWFIPEVLSFSPWKVFAESSFFVVSSIVQTVVLVVNIVNQRTNA